MHTFGSTNKKEIIKIFIVNKMIKNRYQNPLSKEQKSIHEPIDYYLLR